MAVSYPVHPDDAEALLKIRRYLIGYRITEGLNQTQLSQRVNGTGGVVYDLENNQGWQWRLSRLQDWCGAFDLRLRATVKISPVLDRKIHADPEVAPLYQLSCNADPGTWKMFQRAYLTSALRSARIAQKIRAAELGARMGCTDSALWNWERDSDQIMLPKVLHYARSLGGCVDLGWTENP